MNDTMEFVRNMWGAMKVPGMTMPSMSPEEINKQITDLKAVESWLQLNMNMLRSSIQALEMQSATLTTLQTMGENFAQTVKSMTPEPEPEKQEFQSPFTNYANAKPAPEPEPEKPVQAEQSEETVNMAAQFTNPAAWWSVVQDQFSQAVGNAMAPSAETTAKPKTAAAKSNKPKTSSAAKKTSTKTSSGAKKTATTARKKTD
jgi:hypothetical protein